MQRGRTALYSDGHGPPPRQHLARCCCYWAPCGHAHCPLERGGAEARQVCLRIGKDIAKAPPSVPFMGSFLCPRRRREASAAPNEFASNETALDCRDRHITRGPPLSLCHQKQTQAPLVLSIGYTDAVGTAETFQDTVFSFLLCTVHDCVPHPLVQTVRLPYTLARRGTVGTPLTSAAGIWPAPSALAAYSWKFATLHVPQRRQRRSGSCRRSPQAAQEQMMHRPSCEGSRDESKTN